MSLTTALVGLRAKLDAISGLTEHPDHRDGSLAESSGNLDGAYKIRMGGTSNPWPEAAVDPQTWTVPVILEVGQMMGNDRTADAVDEDALTREIRRALQYQTVANATVWGMAQPTVTNVPNTRLRLWSWTFNLRYVE